MDNSVGKMRAEAINKTNLNLNQLIQHMQF